MMKQCNKNGFTLLELLVVAIVLGLLSVVIAQVLFSTMRSNKRTDISQDVKTNGDHAIEIMTRLVQNAKSISIMTPCPEYPSVGDIIDEIKLINMDNGETTLACRLENGIARIASISALQTIYLTNTNVSLGTVSDNTCNNHALAFTCSSTGETPSHITMAFILRQKNRLAWTADSASGTFQTTVTLRN